MHTPPPCCAFAPLPHDLVDKAEASGAADEAAEAAAAVLERAAEALQPSDPAADLLAIYVKVCLFVCVLGRSPTRLCMLVKATLICCCAHCILVGMGGETDVPAALVPMLCSLHACCCATALPS